MRLFVLAAAVATLAACTVPDSNMSDDEEIAAPAATGNEVVMSEPIRQEPGAAPADNQIQPVPDAEGDQCGASEYQHLVGQPRSRIPEAPAGSTWRVTCTACPITMDYSPARLNIFYDEETGIVEEVRCG